MKSKIIKILSKKILIGMVAAIAIISWSFFEVNEAYATDLQSGEIIYVDANTSGFENGSEENPYNTIQKAVNDAEPGDTIFVKDGTYIENIVVNKAHLTIKSESGAKNTIVQVKNAYDNVFEIKADYVKIDGFTAEGSFSSISGIYLNNVNFCEISNNIALHNFYGIFILHSGNNALINNKMFDNDYNFYLRGNSDSHFDNNIDTTNTIDGKPIYYIKNAEYQTYDSSTNAGAFYCISCDSIIVKDLTLTKNIHGVFFWKTENSKIENITVSENIHGIRLLFSGNNNLTNNTVLNNAIGIGLCYSDNSFLTDNITLNTDFGIYLDHSNGNFLTNNTISNNTISNGKKGISLYYSENNKIYHNNFINNGTQLNLLDLMSLTNNSFDNGYPSGGNYWSDYSGEDSFKGPGQDQSGEDGIGDAPYELEDIYVSGKAYDRYPFMVENGWEIVIPFCGDNICEQGETFENCYQDCAKQGIEKYFPYWKFSQGEIYHPTSFYFDNNADVEDNRENYEDTIGDWAKPYVYAHTVEDENYFTIQYWIYMAQNYHWLWKDHEHDWDATVFVVFNKNNLNQPIEVRFARHIYIGVYSWDEIERNNTHPVAYVAQGSHGAYRCPDMGSLDVFNPGGFTYDPNFLNYYQVGNCVEEIEKEINEEQREFCKVENELIKGIAQNEPANGYWPNKFTEASPWKSEDALLWFKNRWHQTRPDGFTSALEFGTACPVDLHIYDPEGNHIGINYNTGTPEIGISDAIFQQKGEKQYIIILNPIKGDYKVEIIGTGNGEYDFTMIASEDMKLIEKKEKKNIPIVENEIQTFTVVGLWESPKEIKQNTISDLNSIENNNKIIQRNIQNAIDLINKSLDENLWIDNETDLDKEQGRKVFNYELKAVKRLELLENLNQKLKLNDNQLSEILKNTKNRLTKADYLLAEIALGQVKNTEIKNDKFKKKIDKLIKKTEKELEKAKQKIEKDKIVQSIIHSKRSWVYSQMAMRFADK